MKNPLDRRLKRDLREEFGKYFVIFVFVCGMIAIVSGFLVANKSMTTAIDNNFTYYNIEDGNFELLSPATEVLLTEIEEEKMSVYENFYIDEKTDVNNSTLRIFKPRNEINRVCVMSGELPANADEIAIDRVYAANNKLSVGQTVSVRGKTVKICGLVALTDYSALYSSQTDMMFDAVKFGVAIMTEEGFDDFGTDNIHYSYSWKYDTAPADTAQAIDKGEDFLGALALKAMTAGNNVVNYIPEYCNQAITMAAGDLEKDGMAFTVFLYIIMAVIAFISAIMSGNTIVKEANVIGTLRASGYTKGELLRHYMKMTILVVLAAAVIGNILGYTLLKDYMAGVYYESYSLTSYETLWNADALISTTVIPIILVLVINFAVLRVKLNLSPLKLIRRDVSRRQKKKAFRLNTKIGIMHRFRIRVIFQNIPNYVTIFVGILLANAALLFGLAFNPMMYHFQDEITENMICDYQYLLKAPQETTAAGAEEFCVCSLETIEGRLKSEGVSVYGIADDSAYVDIEPVDGVYVTNAFAEKFGLSKGDSITLKEPYDDAEYTFTVGGIYYYPSSIGVFMSKPMFCDTFAKDAGYFNGYFSDNEITDIDEAYIATTITEDDLTKTSRQFILSIGGIMTLFTSFGVIMFVLIIYLLSKIIIEKNSQSISMVKILGYTNGEIGRLYVLCTAIVVIASMLITMPICDKLMAWLIPAALSGYAGWLPYYVSFDIFVKMAALGIGSYILIAAFQLWKINRIPKSDALKNAE